MKRTKRCLLLRKLNRSVARSKERIRILQKKIFRLASDREKLNKRIPVLFRYAIPETGWKIFQKMTNTCRQSGHDINTIFRYIPKEYELIHKERFKISKQTFGIVALRGFIIRKLFILWVLKHVYKCGLPYDMQMYIKRFLFMYNENS